MSPDPTLIVFCVIVAVFTGVCWTRLVVQLRARAKERELLNAWWAEQERHRAELAAKGYTVLPANVDPSSLLDDSPGPLPEVFRAPCGEPIRFPASATDRGPRAA